jgi:hypothetical protein
MYCGIQVFFTPLITVPVCIKFCTGKILYKILKGLGIAILFSIILFIAVFIIASRDGFGMR